jgi:predicted MFS family arabinose efflux permease
MLGQSLLMGARGLGAILGPVTISRIAGNSQKRMRYAILCGMLLACAGYVMLGLSGTLLFAVIGVMAAHSGLAMIWVFSTTLLQLSTEDRFRGRVFSTEFSLGVLTMAASSAIAGYFVDRGVPVQKIAIVNGLVMLIPALLWWLAQQLWREPSHKADV